LRHTWATRMAMPGVNLVTLAAMLGHSKIKVIGGGDRNRTDE